MWHRHARERLASHSDRTTESMSLEVWDHRAQPTKGCSQGVEEELP